MEQGRRETRRENRWSLAKPRSLHYTSLSKTTIAYRNRGLNEVRLRLEPYVPDRESDLGNASVENSTFFVVNVSSMTVVRLPGSQTAVFLFSLLARRRKIKIGREKL